MLLRMVPHRKPVSKRVRTSAENKVGDDEPLSIVDEMTDDPRTPNAGKIWTTDQTRLLVAGFDQNYSLEELALVAGRTKAAVVMKLVALGRLQMIGSEYFQLPAP